MEKNNLNIVGIIPARMGSSRFPGKPLEKILGMPMIGHVYHRSKLSQSLNEIYIATCDEEIGKYADSIGAKWIMTMNTHERASDRTAEALKKIEKSTGKRVDIIVMIQGDEPMIKPEMIDMAVEPLLEDTDIKVVNLMAPVTTVEERNDPNCPKVITDKNNYALYFSREPVPSSKKWHGTMPPTWKQVCVIPFTRDFLLKFNELEPTPLEIIESIDMNRVLEYGFKVKMIPEYFETQAVDTLSDLKKVEELMSGDNLIAHYA